MAKDGTDVFKSIWHVSSSIDLMGCIILEALVHVMVFSLLPQREGVTMCCIPQRGEEHAGECAILGNVIELGGHRHIIQKLKARAICW